MDQSFIGTNEIQGILSYLESIDWSDPWLLGLIAFHVVITLMAFLTRNHGNIQAALFGILLVMVYFTESINEVAANNWRSFSRQQYFDSKGTFISIVYAVPMLLNCMIMVANWLWQSSELMIKIKRAELRHQASIEGRHSISNDNAATVTSSRSDMVRKRKSRAEE